MSLIWALCADEYTATLTSCAYCYLSKKENLISKMVLDEIFDLLEHFGVAGSDSEFRKDWLCRAIIYVNAAF